MITQKEINDLKQRVRYHQTDNDDVERLIEEVERLQNHLNDIIMSLSKSNEDADEETVFDDPPPQL